MESKEAVRQACKQRRAALAHDVCQAWTPALTKEILSLKQYKKAHTIMAYLAMPKEANLDALVEYALKEGKQVYVPLCLDKKTMIATRLYDLQNVKTGVLAIRIPNGPYETIEPEDLDLVLVPGAGFDRYGGRIGMGNGYYDRFLHRVKPGHFVGVAWQCQVLDNPIPMDSHDLRMEAIVTEKGYITINRTAL